MERNPINCSWRDAFKEVRNAVDRKIEKAKIDHIMDKIENCGYD